MEPWIVPVVALTVFALGVIAGRSTDRSARRYHDLYYDSAIECAELRARNLILERHLRDLDDRLKEVGHAIDPDRTHHRNVEIIEKLTELVYPDVGAAPQEEDEVVDDDDLGWGDGRMDVDGDPIGEWGMDARDVVEPPEEVEL